MINRYLHYFLPLVFALIVGTSHLFGWFQSLNFLIYDNILNNYAENDSSDIVLIAIDEQSLTDLGRWPWPRETHAQLIDRLTEAQVRSVVFDVIFAEQNFSDPEGDQRFIESVQTNGNVILPIHFEEIRNKGQIIEITPFQPLFSAANGAGHVHIQCDIDGICRSVFLWEGIGSAYWPHLSLALLQQQSGKSLPHSQDKTDKHLSSMMILREDNKLIPFSYSADKLQTVSYSDIIKQRIPLSLLKNKTVFVGATSAGMNDFLATPKGPMAGVEVNAIIYNALRSDALITPASVALSALLAVIFTFTFLYYLTSLSPTRLILSSIAATIAILTLAHVLLAFFKTWHPPAAEILAIICFYPLWSWLRLELALEFLERSLESIQHNAPLAGLSPQNNPSHTKTPTNWNPKEQQLLAYSRYQSDIISRTINQIQDANQAAEKNRQLVIQSLSQLQEAVLVFSLDGEMLLKNALADQLFPEFSAQEGETDHTDLMALEKFININNGPSWNERIEALLAQKRTISFEVQIAHIDGNKDLFVQGQHLGFSQNNQHQAQNDYLIFTITDVTSLKDAERSRLETLNFISHDLRSPMVSILALLENHNNTSKDNPEALATMLGSIENYVKTNLNYAESLLQIGRAENTSEAEFQMCDLHAILDAALLQVQVLAEAKHIHFNTQREDADCWVWGNGDLLERALVNLFSNAIKYSREHTEVTIQLENNNQQATIHVTDQGEGISQSDRTELFQRFRRGKHNMGQNGAGLGLYFVKTVAEKHKGQVSITNTSSAGSTFTFTVPLYAMDEGAIDEE
ncbi:CHASE2 domain-containing protein [Teredinibacter sp. KSP-S5-2]|uniref:CHASE2 domain-containing protein n=1 Tax=Teredinibacter sp. KSP-S5-2 TaxID=3034506 RepID=UPI002934AAE7|nr:CHASE2 domain-containing protein [Teredinibacter sp. KSP-S5-2]WNO08292.1 CHASE2 and HATPase_c domain-containing protein [Teredinibacter sp. KSP-S5-2]